MNNEEIRKRRQERGGFVYFITDGAAIKIGYSAYVEGRRQDLQQTHHAPLQVIASFRGTFDDERVLHRHFEHLNIRGEWFRPSPEIDAIIADLEAGERLINRRLARIADATNGTLRRKIMEHDMPATVSKACHDYAAWLEGRKAAGTLTVEALEIAQRCAMDLKVIERSPDIQSGAFLAMTAAELAKLEAALNHR